MLRNHYQYLAVMAGMMMVSVTATDVHACPGCFESRVQWDNPAIDTWVFLSIGWFFLQTAITAWMVKRDWRPLILCPFVIALNAVAFLIYQSEYVLVLLVIFPVLVCLLALSNIWCHRWTRACRLLTLCGVAIFVPLYLLTGHLAQARENQQTLAERMLNHGYRAATSYELLKLSQMGSGGLKVYRELLIKGHLTGDAHMINLGQVMLMASAAKKLMQTGELDRDMPLILDTMARLEKEYQAIKQPGSTFNPLIGFDNALDAYFNDKYGVTSKPDQSSEYWRTFWAKYSQNKDGNDNAKTIGTEDVTDRVEALIKK